MTHKHTSVHGRYWGKQEANANQKEQTWCGKTRFFGNATRASVFWACCRWAMFETEAPARREFTVVQSGSYYCCSYCLASLNCEGKSNVTQCTNVKVRCLVCFINLPIKRQGLKPIRFSRVALHQPYLIAERKMSVGRVCDSVQGSEPTIMYQEWRILVVHHESGVMHLMADILWACQPL